MVFKFIYRLIFNSIVFIKFYDWLQFLSLLGFKVYENDKQRLNYNEAINLSDKAIKHCNQLYLDIGEYKRLKFVAEGKYGWIFKYSTDTEYGEFFHFDVLVDKINGVRFILLGLEQEQFYINYYSKYRENIDVFYDKLYDLSIDLYPHPNDDPSFYKEFQIEE